MASNAKVLVVKIKFQDDVRRISFKKEPGFNKLKSTLQKLFTYLNFDDYVIKYVDEESDLVTVSSDMELNEAISQSTKLLRLYLVESSRAQSITASALQVSKLDVNAPVDTSNVIHASTLLRTAITPPQKPTGPQITTPQPPATGSNQAIADVWKQMSQTDPEAANKFLAQRVALLKQSVVANREAEEAPKKEEEPKQEMPKPKVEAAPKPEKPTKKKEIRYLARFVKNVTIPDATEVGTCESFTKIWEMRNDGEHAWPAGTKLNFVGGDTLSSVESTEIENEVRPGESVEIAVPMTSPADAGRYVSYWRLVTPEGNRFGHRVWVDVLVVPEGEETTKEPEPEQVDEPTPEPEPIAVEVATPSAPVAEPAQADDKTAVSQATKDALRVLADMGFTNAELCTSLLYRNNNNLMVTIQDLLQGKY